MQGNERSKQGKDAGAALEEEALAQLYRERFQEGFLPRKRDIWRVLCQHFFQRYVAASDTVLDVACGYGEFINSIRCGRKLAADINPDTAQHLDAGVELHAVAADRIASIGQESVDVVFTSNFLEHLENKAALDQFLQQVMQVLKPGGRYLILGPNLRYLPGAYWDFYDHHLGLTDQSLAEALQLQGFTIESKRAKFLPYTTQGKLPTHPLLVRLYLLLPMTWPLLGKQFFVVARKPD
ncbi:MAG: class I SAM-dependent methyltransferase [Pseudomonadota bacterium]